MSNENVGRNLLEDRIDFCAIFNVRNCNPNGDPLGGNQPRVNSDQIGEITHECIRRKIRDRLMEMGRPIFIQSHAKRIDGCTSLEDRLDKMIKKCFTDPALKQLLAENLPARTRDSVMAKLNDPAKIASPGTYSDFGMDELYDMSCILWDDVRMFGSLYAYADESQDADDEADGESESEAPKAENAPKGKGKSARKKGGKNGTKSNSKGISVGVTGAVSTQGAFSVCPVIIDTIQISKSVNGTDNPENPDKKNSDTLGLRYRVGHGLYKMFGHIYPLLAQKNGVTVQDMENLKAVLPILFVNDASTSRPIGSMEVVKVFWWVHPSKNGNANGHGGIRLGNCSPRRIEESVKITPKVDTPSDVKDYDIIVEDIPDVVRQDIDGF